MQNCIPLKLIYPLVQNLKEEELLWLQKLEQTIFQLSINHLFNMDFLGEKMGLSRRQLQRRIKKTTGLSPKEYTKEVRLLKAIQIMESGETETVKETALILGYTNADYFSKIFKNRFDAIPSSYLK